MALTNTALQAAYTAVKALGGYVSLHTADPGLTGASEVTGGAYVRVLAALPAGANGTGTAPSVDINVPAGTTVTHVGVWTAASSGSFIGGSAALSPSLPFPVAGKASIVLSETFISA